MAKKLTPSQVVELRTIAVRGIGYRHIADKFGISEQYAAHVARGRVCPDAGGPIAPPRRRGAAPRVVVDNGSTNINTLRVARGLSMERLCDLATDHMNGSTMSVSWLRRIAQGHSTPHLTTAAAIARALGVSIEQAFGLERRDEEAA